MHELGVMESVLNILVESAVEHNATKITHVTLVAGSLTNIIPKWASLFFKMIAKGTIAEGAELSFRIIPARILCRQCGKETEFTVEKMLFHCGHCGSDEITLVSGKEFYIQDMEAIAENDMKGSSNDETGTHY